MVGNKQDYAGSTIPNKAIKPDRTRHFLRRGLFVVFFGLVCADQAIAAPFQLPPIVEPASAEHHIGKVIFVELVTPDLTAAEHFYGGLFGWTFSDLKAGTSKYAQAYLNGFPVAGLLHKEIPAGEQRQPSWLSFISVRNVDEVEKIAKKNGAKILREPHDVSGRGRQAVLADPQGAVFAVLASSSGDTADVLAEPGEWIWSSLITTDPDTDAAFYQTLFDYDVFEMPSADGAEHLSFASEDYARASANPLPANNPHAHPHWLNYVRVDDAIKATEKVVALGGRVLVAPYDDRHGGKAAVVADPSGAPFGLLEWSDTETKEVTK